MVYVGMFNQIAKVKPSKMSKAGGAGAGGYTDRSCDPTWPMQTGVSCASSARVCPELQEVKLFPESF